jgi:hypothetical protein
MTGKCDEILEAIDTKTVRRKIISPCKQADATYQSKHLFPKTFPEFQEDCAGYWKHLNIRYYNLTTDNYPSEEAIAFSREYIEKAFYRTGGMRHAFQKAQDETFNSVKFHITSLFIEDAIERYVTTILQTHVNPLDYEQIEDLMKEYVDKFQIKLVKPGELPMMIAHYEIILKSHAKRHGQLEIDRQALAIVNE